MKTRIELVVFSGRPNPGWMLEKGEADTILAMLQNLPPYKTPEPLDGLGYRGFIIHVEKEGQNQIIHVYAGKVWENDDQEKILEDKKHVEQLLLRMAEKKGYGELLKELGIE